jgi:hypothetical protein
MPTIGFTLTSIRANIDEKEIEKGPEVTINSTPTILSLEKKDLNIGKVKSVLLVNFKFKTTYEPEIGEITLNGNVIFESDDIDKILKTWKDTKKLDDTIAVDVLNSIMRKCLAKVVYISDELRLPPPVRFPVVKAKEDTKK